MLLRQTCHKGTSKPNNCWAVGFLFVVLSISRPVFQTSLCKSWSRRLALFTSHALEAPFAVPDHCSSTDADTSPRGCARSNCLVSLVFMFSFTLFEPKHFNGFASTDANSWIPSLLFGDLWKDFEQQCFSSLTAQWLYGICRKNLPEKCLFPYTDCEYERKRPCWKKLFNHKCTNESRKKVWWRVNE